MKITLDNFENYVPQKILYRGEEYYESGAVTKLEEAGDGIWNAEVEGTDTYEVGVEVDEDGSISWDCDCPYDGGAMCKHVVAVLLAIRKEREKGKGSAFSKKASNSSWAKAMKENAVDAEFAEIREGGKNAPVNTSASSEEKEFERLFALEDAEGMREFILGYAKAHGVFKSDLLAYLREKYLKNRQTVADYRSEVVMAFQQYETYRYSRYYEDDMHDWSAIFARIDALFDDSRELMKMGNAEAALAVSAQFFTTLTDEFDPESPDCYEEEVDVSYHCEQAAKLMLEALDHASVCQESKDQVLKELKEVARHGSMYRNYDIYDINDLLQQVTIIVQSEEEALKLLDKLIREQADKYDFYKLVRRKIDLLRRMKEEEEAENVVKKYLYLKEIRSDAIDHAIGLQQYDEALRLADEGIAKDREGNKNLWNIKPWLEKKQAVYDLLKDKEKQIDTARMLFICERGTMDIYHKLKAWVEADQWKPFLTQLLAETDCSFHDYGGNSVLADIYVEEKDGERLFQFLAGATSDRLDLLDSYAHHLPKEYADRLIGFYICDLRLYAEQNMGRDHYTRVARSMKKMQQLPGGREDAHLLAEEFRTKYKKRRAMMEEISAF
ncbi:MAG: SWIM zinc finger family protein [Bacteroidaceae bacterium]|nr:SWIM zinc finger family protein [Bacteroidaceae bacterium]